MGLKKMENLFQLIWCLAYIILKLDWVGWEKILMIKTRQKIVSAPTLDLDFFQTTVLGWRELVFRYKQAYMLPSDLVLIGQKISKRFDWSNQ
jgi:hypothetical protein